jgi:polar amino acid transport system substrate-binding protein
MRRWFLIAAMLVATTLTVARAALAQGTPPATGSIVTVPRFMDPRVRIERPEPLNLRAIRFLTDDEFPPLHFADPDGQLVGFSVDLTRAICERLMVACTIQARRFDTLLDALAEGRGDVVAAAIPVTPALRSRVLAGAIYHRMPARFVAAKALERAAITADSLKGRSVAVVARSAHEAFLKAFFPEVVPIPVADASEALAKLVRREADFVFGDGLTLAAWLASRAGVDHAFAGGPYLDSRYFGEGVGLLVRPDDQNLRRNLDFALQQIWDDGTYAKLYLRYFPVGLY